jgi:hypothetical protein
VSFPRIGFKSEATSRFRDKNDKNWRKRSGFSFGLFCSILFVRNNLPTSATVILLRDAGCFTLPFADQRSALAAIQKGACLWSF